MNMNLNEVFCIECNNIQVFLILIKCIMLEKEVIRLETLIPLSVSKLLDATYVIILRPMTQMLSILFLSRNDNDYNFSSRLIADLLIYLTHHSV